MRSRCGRRLYDWPPVEAKVYIKTAGKIIAHQGCGRVRVLGDGGRRLAAELRDQVRYEKTP